MLEYVYKNWFEMVLNGDGGLEGVDRNLLCTHILQMSEKYGFDHVFVNLHFLFLYLFYLKQQFVKVCKKNHIR